MQSAAARVSEASSHPKVLGKAAIVRTLYEGRDISATWEALMKRVSANLEDSGAFFDLANILYAMQQPEKAALSQKAAIEISRTFHIQHGTGAGPTVLVFVVAGDFMANTPIEFLLERSDANILLHFVDSKTADLSDLPEHDVAFVGIGESPENADVLEHLQSLLRGWGGPVINNAPGRIMALARDVLAETLKDEPSILAPLTTRVRRDTLLSLNADLQRIAGISSWPIIVRPVGTHAGGGLEKLGSPTELESYLQVHGEPEFYIAPFVDYSGPDGKFRKQRIAFIDGEAYASHLAVSEHWMVHYLSAGMAEYADRRAEEASWMADFDREFAVRHARAFDALYRTLGLDYFAIDCAELPDGRLLLFEADVAMIVHAMDSESVFPYKKLAMARLFSGFEMALGKRISRMGATFAEHRAHAGG
ncbi:MAG TPA: tetratricopeptide repeat-containing protein, partial [Hyphomicrobium sp.]|nr:tetratricopeptide repeat-containing protein [Hyphomicrobium sp.]